MHLAVSPISHGLAYVGRMEQIPQQTHYEIFAGDYTGIGELWKYGTPAFWIAQCVFAYSV